MEEKYFIEYKTDRADGPYELPEELRNELMGIKGLVIEHESSHKPVVIASLPKDELDKVKSLDSVVRVYDNVQFSLMGK